MTMKHYILILSLFFFSTSFIYGAGDHGDKYKNHGAGVLLSQTMSKSDYDMLMKYGMKGLPGQGYNTIENDSVQENNQAVSVEVTYSKPKIKKSKAKKLAKKRGMSFSSMALKVNRN